MLPLTKYAFQIKKTHFISTTKVYLTSLIFNVLILFEDGAIKKEMSAYTSIGIHM